MSRKNQKVNHKKMSPVQWRRGQAEAAQTMLREHVDPEVTDEDLTHLVEQVAADVMDESDMVIKQLSRCLAWGKSADEALEALMHASFVGRPEEAACLVCFAYTGNVDPEDDLVGEHTHFMKMAPVLSQRRQMNLLIEHIVSVACDMGWSDHERRTMNRRMRRLLFVNQWSPRTVLRWLLKDHQEPTRELKLAMLCRVLLVYAMWMPADQEVAR
jgi:hypothetical protein